MPYAKEYEPPKLPSSRMPSGPQMAARCGAKAFVPHAPEDVAAAASGQSCSRRLEPRSTRCWRPPGTVEDAVSAGALRAPPPMTTPASSMLPAVAPSAPPAYALMPGSGRRHPVAVPCVVVPVQWKVVSAMSPCRRDADRPGIVAGPDLALLPGAVHPVETQGRRHDLFWRPDEHMLPASSMPPK